VTRGRTLLTLGALTLASVAALHVGARDASAWDLRIGTRTQLTDCKVKAEGTVLSVDGTLRDNVNQGIREKIITVRFQRQGRAEFRSLDVKTDRTGRFYGTLEVDEIGTYAGTFTFSGEEPHYAPAKFETGPLELRRGEVALGLALPSILLEGDEPSASGRVSANAGPNPAADLPLTVTVGGDPLELKTGPKGTASFPIPQGGVARVKVEARFDGDKRYTAASAQGEVRVLRGASLVIEADNVRARLERGVRVEGDLVDREGPVPKAPVDLVLSQGGVEQGRYRTATDEDGHLSVFIPESKLKPGPLQVDARVLVGRRTIDAQPAQLDVIKTGAGALPWLLGALLVGVVGVYAGGAVRDWWRRRERAKPTPKARGRVSMDEARRPNVVPVSVEEALEGGVQPTRDGIAGILWDSQLKRAVGAGEVRLLREEGGAESHARSTQADARGRFSFEGLEAGRYALRVTSLGFVGASYKFSIPHGGELALFRFPLVPVRVVVRDLFEDLSEDLTREREVWGRLTPREVLKLALRALAEVEPSDAEGRVAFEESLERALGQEPASLAPNEAVSAVVSVLEEVYYSRRLHDEQLARVVERLAALLRAKEAA
jgi:hypothetical protein